MDILDRISLLLGNREQKELTDYLGLKSAAFSEWKSGKSKSYKKYLIEIAEFFHVSIDYLVYGKNDETLKSKSNNQDQSPKIKIEHNYNGDVGNVAHTTTGNLNIYNGKCSSKAETETKEAKDDYDTIKSLIAQFGVKEQWNTIFEIESMLESEVSEKCDTTEEALENIFKYIDSFQERKKYKTILSIEGKLKKKIKNVDFIQIIYALGNTFVNYILDNIDIFDLIVISLAFFSCFSCIFEMVKSSLTEIPYFISNLDYPIIFLSGSMFFINGAFCIFMFFYSKKYGKHKHKIISLLLFIIVVIFASIFADKSLVSEKVITGAALMLIIPIILLIIYSCIRENNKNIKYT